MIKLNDKYYRELLIEELIENHGNDPDTRIIHELGIDFGSNRVDVAVVNGIIHGYEIKSDCDTLDRLPQQIQSYNKLFERMTVVTARKFYEHAKELVPDWWGIQVISQDGSRLITKRTGRKKSSQDKSILLKLLWKDELEGFVDVLGYPKKYKSLKKQQLLHLFNQVACIETIRPYVYQALKTRQFWRN